MFFGYSILSKDKVKVQVRKHKHKHTNEELYGNWNTVDFTVDIDIA